MKVIVKDTSMWMKNCFHCVTCKVKDEQ